MSESQDSAEQTRQPEPNRPRRRRSRVWRVLKWALLVLFVLVLALAGLVCWVGGTRSGTEFAWRQAKQFMPADIHIASVKGRLIGPLHIRGVDYDTDAMKVHIGSIDFDMDFSAIWHRTVHIKHLDVHNVEYTVTQATPKQPRQTSQPFSMPKRIHLPVTVIVDRVAVTHVTAVTAPKAKPVKVDRLQLTGARLAKAQWRIKSVTGHGPMFDLDAHAAVTPNSGYNTKLHAKVDLRLPHYAPLSATADITGKLDDLQLAANVAAPYNLKLNGHVTDALSKPTIDAELQAHGVKTQAISKTLPQIAADAEIKAKGPIDDLGLQLSGHVDSADYGKATLDGGLHYTPQAIDIHDLKIGVPATHGQLTANGTVAMASGNNMNLTVNWSNLAWPLSAKPAYKSGQGKVRLTGSLDHYDLNTNLVWQVVGQTQGKLAARGSGSMKAFDLKSLDISGGPGHITGHARTRWSPKLDVRAHLQGRHINPGAIVANIPGDFNLNLDVTATRVGQQIHADLKSLTAHGSLRHQPLDLKAKAQYLGNHVKVDTLHLVAGAATADVNGTFGWTPNAKLDGQWSVHSTDLSTIMPGLAGSLQTDGHVSGRFKAPDITAKLTAHHLDAYGDKVAAADMNAKVDWSGATQSKVDLTVNGIDASGQKIRKVALNLDGTPAKHRLSLKLDSDTARADLALTGSLNKKSDREQFKLRRLTAGYGKLAPWSLASPASGSVSAKAQSIENACLTSGSARLCLSGSHDAKRSKGHVKLSDFNYDYAKHFFPAGLKVTGSVSGQVDAKLPTGGTPQVNANLQTSAGTVSMANAQSKRVKVLNMQPGHIKAKMANNGMHADVDLPLAGSDGIRAQARVASGSGSLIQHPLHGRLHIGLASMAFLAKLSPQVDTFDGHFAGDMQLGGTLAKPTVRGRMGLDASKVVLVTPGLTLTDVSLAAQGRGNTIGITAAAKSGGGTLNANGNISLANRGQTVNLAIKGDHFQIAHIPDVTAYVSPDLKVAVTPARVNVTGSVTIPQAAITPKNLPASGVTAPSSDQVIVTHKAPATQVAARAIHADVNVILGKKVHINGFGLKADLGGNLRVVQQPGNEPTGTGAIQITKGSYQAYGQNLDIQKGKIVFAGGPVSEPGVDIKAARYPTKDVTVGVHVHGSIKNPKLELFSDPSMTQSEQLSWLLLGRPLNATNGQQSSLVARAALALGSSRSNKVLQNIGNKLGLDNVGIGAGAGKSSSEAAFTVGKYLSPKLYIGYGLGLFDQVSTVTMRYTLSSHWTLETSSSSQATGGDIIWRFDH
ncbi:translocation/assembly module TamB domain-containing protein [Salinisphaera sp. LB1]|uniref:translocation/assembly module TamB domain-containing protein n=1 Tax=Salinisphaera sp. LB1 TaxID=2183911 RepID=UPI000D708800|nr:translocation/assembly module TamB domain-containing protein [Salinisphaera sp. LB1]AWN15588.1 putative exported protein [Salinisphaera sp. LB1]